MQKSTRNEADPETRFQAESTYLAMGAEHRELLESYFYINFWRGLVENIDLMGEIGLDEKGRAARRW